MTGRFVASRFQTIIAHMERKDRRIKLKMVIFTSVRQLERAENLKAVYDAYDGEKKYIKTIPNKNIPDLEKYDLQVTDELVNVSAKKCLFIGHGMGLGKTYGLDQPNPYYRNPKAIDCAIASSKEIVPQLSKQLGLPEEKIHPIGMPRTDAYFKAEPIDGDYHLYAPTFHEGPYAIDWTKIDIHTKKRMIVKTHMISGKVLRHKHRNIEEVSASEPSTEYLMNCKTLITDYSSIMFDAMVIRKPVVLFAKDAERYMRVRGMYKPYPNFYSDYYATTELELCGLLETAEWTEHLEELRRYHAGECDGHSTERVIELIRSML